MVLDVKQCVGRMLAVVLVVMVMGCGSDDAPTSSPQTAPQGFVFLGLGADTVYNRKIRDRLRNELGSDAIATRTPIDLSINYVGFLGEFFPEIDQLNRQMNDAADARVEHDTIELMYRNAQRQQRPFRYIELMFSNATRHPLYFKINANKEGSAIVKTFHDKYGPPRAIDWKDRGGLSWVWADNNNRLIVSVTEDRFGEAQYDIVIYFSDNIRRLIEIEHNEALRREQAQQRAGEKAF